LNLSAETTNAIIAMSPLIVAAPFIAGALIILGARFSKTLSMLLSVGAVFYGFVHSLLILEGLRQNPAIGTVQFNWDWFQS
jgi:NADH:ubiquinone oxidoreductase subunit 6 (subunit J)